MSRSNPQGNDPNPAVRWFEWNGEHGAVRFYDRELKKNISVALPFQFLLLDELASVRGWHDASDSGIYSNEVKDTRTDILVVKSFKGGALAEGIYKDIKDRVNTLGGQFVANCYIAFKDGAELKIGSLRFKGAALGSWMEFRKNHRSVLFEKAITVTGFTEGKKGKVTFRMPTFEAKDISDETNATAMTLDREFQKWLNGYFDRRTSDRASSDHDDDAQSAPEDDGNQGAHLTDDDIPF